MIRATLQFVSFCPCIPCCPCTTSGASGTVTIEERSAVSRVDSVFVPWEKRPRHQNISERILPAAPVSSRGSLTLGGMSVESARRVTKLMMAAGRRRGFLERTKKMSGVPGYAQLRKLELMGRGSRDAGVEVLPEKHSFWSPVGKTSPRNSQSAAADPPHHPSLPQPNDSREIAARILRRRRTSQLNRNPRESTHRHGRSSITSRRPAAADRCARAGRPVVRPETLPEFRRGEDLGHGHRSRAQRREPARLRHPRRQGDFVCDATYPSIRGSQVLTSCA